MGDRSHHQYTPVADPHSDAGSPAAAFRNRHAALSPVDRVLVLVAGIFLLPLRALTFLISLVVYYGICWVATIGLDLDNLRDPLPMWRRWPIRFFGQCTGRITLFCCGIYWINCSRNDNIDDSASLFWNGLPRSLTGFCRALTSGGSSRSGRSHSAKSSDVDLRSTAATISLASSNSVKRSVSSSRLDGGRSGSSRSSLLSTTSNGSLDLPASASTDDVDGGVHLAAAHRAENAWPRIIVSNHVSYLDILYHMYEGVPSFVAKDGMRNVLFIGLITKAYQSIFVSRSSADSARQTMEEIKRRSEHPEGHLLPSMLLFPEGTTSNGRGLLQFKLGAFVPGLPVKPIVIQYPFRKFDLSYTTMSAQYHAMWTALQWWNEMTVVHMPVYYPSAEEQADPNLFAHNVRAAMAEEAGLDILEYTISDKFKYLKEVCHGGKNMNDMNVPPATR